ncbi:hypothetical protein [Oceanicoccus sp. KOV_DT_Chl]|uniref:hypothetical protein n=1 Tax=Oceanicoccus sp. KOV_DT_Chl TaxID=1904639 RepID=UPI000C7D2E24|nr:hypothetical protein [Oceanicoccus sp. KOV_DT_Chl]
MALPFSYLFALLISISVTACGGGGDSPTPSQTDEIVFDPLAEVSATGPYVSAIITFESLPSSIDVNYPETLPETGTGRIEYSFEIIFDVDNDMRVSEGDIKFYTYHAKEEGDLPKSVSFDSFSDQDVLRYEGDNRWIGTRGGMEIQVINNDLVFKVPVSIQEGLDKISEYTQIRAKLNIAIPSLNTRDYFPTSTDFTQSQSNFSLLDEVGENPSPDFLDISEISIVFSEE